LAISSLERGWGRVRGRRGRGSFSAGSAGIRFRAVRKRKKIRRATASSLIEVAESPRFFSEIRNSERRDGVTVAADSSPRSEAHPAKRSSEDRVES
jgi:hypothetical protein